LRTNIQLAIAGSVLLALYYAGSMATGKADFLWFVPLVLIQGAVFAVASLVAFRGANRRSTIAIVVAFGLLFRVLSLLSHPFASTDIYRYVWDGRVSAAGINPYAYVPADKRLMDLRDDAVYPLINRPATARTIYPPIAQAAFYLVTRFGGVFSMKTAMTLFDLLTLIILMRLLLIYGVPVQRVILYAWHPLVIWEFAGNGHVDAIAIALIAAAILAYQRDRRFLVGVALGAAALVKFFPLVLLAPFYRRWDWKMPLAFVVLAVASYIPFLEVGTRVLGYLPGYAHEEGLDTGQRFYLLNLFHTLFRINISPVAYVIAGALAITALWVLAQRVDPARTRLREFFALAIATMVTVLLSPAYPWYFTWLVPLCALAPSRSVLYLTLLAPILYLREVFDSTTLVLILDSILFVPMAYLAIRSLLFNRQTVLRTLEAHA